MTQSITERLVQASIIVEEDILNELNSTTQGLSDQEAALRLEQYGTNELSRDQPPAWFIQFLACFKNPFILILLSLAAFSYVMDEDMEAVVIISTMVAISILITFTQEYRSTRTAEKLKAMVKTTANVIRQSDERKIDLRYVVPGDIIQLAAGDMIPADVRLIQAKNLLVSESALTGEAMPVEKSAAIPKGLAKLRISKKDIHTFDLNNMCYMGTNVISGSARAVVVTTGIQTYWGTMAKQLIGKKPLTSFDKGVKSITFVLIRFMFIMIPIILLINGFTKGDWLEALLFGLSVAVGLTPEMLPVIVAGNLAKGAVAMSRKKVVIKRLNAIQNLGAMDVLCTDKTGTLTEDKIILEKHINIDGEADPKVLEYAYLNGFYQTGLRNLLDEAVLEHAFQSNIIGVEKEYGKLDEIPFDFDRRRMSVVVKNNDTTDILICKGAPEEVISNCAYTSIHGASTPLTQEIKSNMLQLVNEMNQDGLRVLAVAVRTTESQGLPYGVHDETDMELIGFLAFLDPPKETAKAAIHALKENGITIKVITGDNEFVTRKVCQDVGIEVDKVILGTQIDEWSDDQLAVLAEQTTIFAKINPLQKARIVRVLKSKGHTVGFLGDGINDAVALKESDVGISVDTAIDIAKESADIILLEKSLMVLEQGVIQGRITFGNIIKYIKMTASSNFGNMFSVLVASAFIPFLPMLPIHLLIQNLFYDVSQISIPWDKMDKEYLKKPQKWDSKSVSRFMVFIGPISSIFDITTYALMWYVFSANSVEHQSLFQSGWFIEGLLSQTLIVHMIRTEKIPFIQSTASRPVLVLTALIMCLGVYIPFSPFGSAIGLEPLPMSYFPWLVVTLLSYCLLTQAVKKWYIRRFNEWL
ncbi:magnesium-translocating P-type ATPase [Paenibacillus paeoniae]|nr:magnesium-translocating P-type ATPase [Paenibacillus paeoniae]